MPSLLSPRLRWRPASLPLLEAGLDEVETAHRIICGALTLWSSRRTSFDWADHPDTEIVYRYCVARINGNRDAPRPTPSQIGRCLRTVADGLDRQAYQALNLLMLSLARNRKNAQAVATSETKGRSESSAWGAMMRYGELGEPPATRFVDPESTGQTRVPGPFGEEVSARAGTRGVWLRAALAGVGRMLRKLLRHGEAR